MSRLKRIFNQKQTQSISIYLPVEERFHVDLTNYVAEKNGFDSTSEFIRAMLKKALQDNGALDSEGRSLVSGIGPDSLPQLEKKARAFKKTSFKKLR